MKKAILVIATLLITLVVRDVHAQVIVGYAEDSDSLNNYQTSVNALGFNTLTLARTKNCSSTTSCSTIINDSLNTFGWLDTGSLSLNNYGFASQTIVNEGVTNGHLYSYTGLYCFNSSINATGYTMYIYGTGTAQTTYDGLGLYRLSDIRFIHSANSSSFDYCYQVQNYFETDGKSSWIMQQIRSNSGSRRGIFWGYRLVDLGSITGLTSSQVQNIINNATSSQTTAIQSSITASTNSINNRITAMDTNISNAIEDTNDILTQDHNYNNNASETIEGQDDMDDMSEAEDNLMGELDFSGAQDLEITINPHASQYIWQIVERLRTLPGVTILMTSILGLGIIKMILNR